MSFKKYFPQITITFIFLLGFFLRVYKLGNNPPGLYLDEAAQGYNAYSILETGRDEFGKSLPILFRSFNDFKTPVYTYLSIPFIYLFGLNIFSIRFLSAISGSLTILFTYLILNKITKGINAQKLALTTLLLLAISPWHILLSRGAFEVNLSLLLLVSGLYYFYLGLEKPKFLTVSSILFAICITSYHAQRIIVPVLMMSLFLRHIKTLLSKKFKRHLLSGLLTGFILLLPTLFISITPGFSARAIGLNLFNKFGVLTSIKEIVSLYLSYYSPRFMFDIGDYDQKMLIPELSTFFKWQFPFYIYGLYHFSKSKKSEFKSLILALLLISPIPASITRDPYSTIRALPLVIPQITVISFGIVSSFNLITKIGPKNIFVRNSLLSGIYTFLLVIALTFSLLKLKSSMFTLFPYFNSQYWNYGYQELSQSINEISGNQKIVLDNTRLVEPYIELLFFLCYDPLKYQKDDNEVASNDYYDNLTRDNNKIISNINIKPISWKEDLLSANYLIGDHLAISDDQIKEHNFDLIKEIYYPNGEVAFRIVKTN